MLPTWNEASRRRLARIVGLADEPDVRLQSPLEGLSYGSPMAPGPRASYNRVERSPGGPAIAPISLNLAIDEFLEDVARAASTRSAETYRTALARFAECLDERLRRTRRLPRRKPDEPLLQLELAELCVDDAVEFARWLESYMARSRGRAPSQSMLFTYTSAVQSF